MQKQIIFTHKINKVQKEQVTKLFYEQFGSKMRHLWILSNNNKKGEKVLKNSIDFENGIFVLENDNVIAFLGYNTSDKCFLHFSYDSFNSAFNIYGSFLRNIITKYLYKPRKKVLLNEINIEAIVVSPHFQGKGIGKRLLEKINKYAIINQKNVLTLEVINTNSNAIRLYERFGYTMYKEQKTGIFTKKANFSKVYYMKKQN